MKFILNNLYVLRGVLNPALYKELMKYNSFILDCLNTDFYRPDWDTCSLASFPDDTIEERKTLVALNMSRILALTCEYRILNKKIASMKSEIKLKETLMKLDDSEKRVINPVPKDFIKASNNSTKSTIGVWKETIKKYKFEKALCYSSLEYSCYRVLNIIKLMAEQILLKEENI